MHIHSDFSKKKKKDLIINIDLKLFVCLFLNSPMWLISTVSHKKGKKGLNKTFPFSPKSLHSFYKMVRTIYAGSFNDFL